MKRIFDIRLIALLAVAAIGVAGCGGGGHGSAVLPASSNSTGTGNGTTTNSNTPANWGTVTFSIPAATSGTLTKSRVTAATTKNGGRLPLYLSPGGNAICVSVTNLDPVTQGVFGSGYAGAQFVTCLQYTPTAPLTISVPAPPGHDTFTIAEYSVPNPTTELPFTSTATATLPAGAVTPLVSTPVPNIGTSNTDSITLTQAVVANAAAQVVTVSSNLGIVVGTVLNVDQGKSTQEFVTVTATGAGTISGIFAQNHANGAVVSGVISLPAGATQSINALLNPTGAPATITLTATVASVFLVGGSATPTLATPLSLPIQAPLREQGAFITALDSIGVPIPVVGLDASGTVIPGSPPGAGTLPNPATDSITLSSSETGPGGASTTHAKLYMIDDVNGMVLQTEVPGTTKISITQLNALDAADNVSGLGTPGDAYFIALADDGAAATKVTSVTVTLNAKLNNVAVPAQTLTLSPQSTIYSAATGAAPATGYADAGGPYTAAADIACTLAACLPAGSTAPAGGLGFWVTDQGNLAEVGTARYVVATAGALTGLAYDGATIAKQLVAVDNNVVEGASYASPPTSEFLVPTPSGVFFFDPNTLANLPVAVQDASSGFYIGFQHPVGVAWVPGGFIYVVENNNIWALDPAPNGTGGLQTIAGNTMYVAEAENGQMLQLSSPLKLTSAPAPTGIGVIATGTSIANGKLYIADTGNNRVVSVTNLGGTATVTSIGTVPAPVGLAVSGTTLYVTTQSGQMYSIATFATAPGTPTSFSLTTGSVKDGGIGALTIGSGAALTAFPYAVQGAPKNFFGSASVPTSPYSLAPFPNLAVGPVLPAAAQGQVLLTPTFFTVDTSNGSLTGAVSGAVKATFGIVPVPAAQAAGNAALTSDSILFTDNGNVRTLIP